MEMSFSQEDLKNAAQELQIKSMEWNKTVDEIKNLSEKTEYAENLKFDIERLIYTGSVIKEYAVLLQYAADKYDENEKSIIHKFEV